MIINGAVVENVGTNAKFVVHNESAILREKEVLTDEDTATPASRVYYSLQCAYVFPQQKEEHLARFREFLSDFIKACPSTGEVADEIMENVDEGKFYKGLKLTQKLINHESQVFAKMQKDMEAQLGAAEGDAPGPENEEEADPPG